MVSSLLEMDGAGRWLEMVVSSLLKMDGAGIGN
jgi:hypothetical protein